MSSYFTKSCIYYVNSANKSNITETNSNFSYQFTNLNLEDFDRVVVLSASIPKSFYLIQSGFNTFILQEGITQTTITIPQGNYNRNSLASTVQSLLTSNSPNKWTYTISYPNINITADTGTYTFTVSGNSSQPSLIFTTSLYEQLGFNINSTNPFVSNTLVSPNVTNLSIETTLFLHSNMSQNLNSDNVLQEIYSNGEASYSYINFINVCPHEYSKILNTSGSNVFNFYLTDEFGNIINTNGININFTIMVYKTNNIDRMIKGFLKMLTLMNESDTIDTM